MLPFELDRWKIRKFQVMWVEAKYAVTENLDVIGAHYRYIQNSFFGTVGLRVRF
jgi:hypothetical protein